MNNAQQTTNNRKRTTTNGQRTTMNGERSFIPYGRQWIDEEDIQAVVEVLRSDWLTTGPKVAEFEQAFADYVGAKYAVAVNNGTAALHAAMYALDIGLGDVVILPPMTFVATANAVVFQGGTPVFADVDPDTLLIDPNEVEDKITPKTKAIVAVDYAGHPCDYDALRTVAAKHDLFLVADACHALGAEYKGSKVGSLADLTVFSFHPLKHITTGEGGMIVTDNLEFAQKMRTFRNHGINTDHRQRSEQNTWYYEMEDLGYNYRITDIQCALGISQLQKLPKFLKRRCEIAALYDEALADIPGIEPLGLRADVLTAKHFAKHQTPGDIHSSSDAMRHVYPVESLPNGIRSPFHRGEGYSTGAPCSMPSNHAYHLYVVRLSLSDLTAGRSAIFSDLREMGIGVNVHYIPVHLHPYYRECFGHREGEYPVSEKLYRQLISLPIYPAMHGQDIGRVVEAVREVVNNYAN